MNNNGRHPLPYEEVHIGSLRGVRDITLRDCREVNLLVGDNNSGKTTILEGLYLLAAAHSTSQWQVASLLRGTWPLIEAGPSRSARRLETVKWLFPTSNDSTGPIQLGAKGNCPFRSVRVELSDIYGVPPEKTETSAGLLVEGMFNRRREDSEPGIELSIRSDPNPYYHNLLDFGTNEMFRMIMWERSRPYRSKIFEHVPIAIATPVSHRSDSYLNSRASHIIRQKRKAAALELLRAVDERITDFTLVTADTEQEESINARRDPAFLHIEYEGLGLVPIHSLGDGLRRAIHLVGLLVEIGEGGVILIDEIEVGMHTSVLQKVFRWLCSTCIEFGIQVFATTHSLEAVDSILQSLDPEKLSLYRLELDGVKHYGGEILRTARIELGQEVR